MAELSNQEKVDAFKKHWRASGYGPVWNDDAEWDIYRNWIIRKDPFMVRDAIWKLRDIGAKYPNRGRLARVYHDMEEKINKELRYNRDHKPPEPLKPCTTCNSEGLSWAIVEGFVEIHPCDCPYGFYMLREYYGEAMTLFEILDKAKWVHDVGCFETPEDASAFLQQRYKQQGVIPCQTNQQ